MPIVSHVINRLYEWTMARARAEDDPIFRGQLVNESMGARSTTAWSYDVVATRYHKWQGRKSSGDIWFKDIDHARRRYLPGDSA